MILLAGAFGQSNPGDEALLRAFVAALGHRRVCAVSSTPAETAAEHGIAAVGRDDLRDVLGAVRACDAVVVAGGTVFKTLHPSTRRRPGALLRRLAALALAAKLQRKPFALVGVGAGRLGDPAARTIARAVVNAADLLILRDEESASRLAGAGATAPFRVGADAAWTVLDGAPTAREPFELPERGPVVVALSHLAGGPELANVLATQLMPLSGPLHLQPWQPQDVSLAHDVAARVPSARVVPAPADLAAARDSFAGARLVIGLRFHALVAAAAAGIPFVAYAHEPKHAGLARRLGQPCVEPGAPLADAVREATTAPSRAAIAAERRRAGEGFRLLRVLISGGRTEEAASIDGLALRPEEWVPDESDRHPVATSTPGGRA